MDEQHDQSRVFIAIGLTLVIFLGWQWLMTELRPPPPEPPAASETAAERAAEGQSGKDAPAKPGAPSLGPGLAAEGAAAPSVEQEQSFETALFKGTLSSTGALRSFSLKEYEEQRLPDAPLEPVSLVTAPIDGKDAQALVRLTVGGKPGPAMSFVEAAAGQRVLRGATAEGVEATLVFKPREGAYAIDYELTLENRSSAAVQAGGVVTMALEPHAGAEKGSFLAPPSDLIAGFCATAEGVERWMAQDAAEDQPVVQGAEWAGLDRQYFVVALLPPHGGVCRVSSPAAETVQTEYTLPGEELQAGARWQKTLTVFLGPKRDNMLKAVAPELKDVIDYDIWGIPLGFIARPMVVVLNVFHGVTGSWGMAIILLTFLVKLLLFPVTYKSSVSMRRMQLLKPELDKLKERLGNDRERMQMEQMKLFRDKGVNPLGGCLPMLLQMPVWFALYRMLWSSVDLYQQEFLWLDNLTAKESFPWLSIAFGALTVVQQKLQPTTMDSQQAKIMLYVMPLVFTVFMIGLPSGLVLYIVVNSILTIFQQIVINRRQVSL